MDRSDASHTIGQELKGIALFVGVVWAAFFLNWIVFPIDFNSFGLVPRTLTGTVGIVTMPFLHANWQHLLSNTVPLFVLLALLAGSKARSWGAVAGIIFVSGVLLWVCGRYAVHVGASGLVFGLAAFLIVSGLLERRIIPLIVALIVGILYGGTLLSGILPTAGSHVSWDGHLCGAVAGGLIAWFATRNSGRHEEAVAL